MNNKLFDVTKAKWERNSHKGQNRDAYPALIVIGCGLGILVILTVSKIFL